MLLRSVGLASHITDDPPDATNKVAKAWRISDEHVMATLCMSVDTAIRSSLEDHNTAKEMWDYLKARFQQSSSALRYSTQTSPSPATTGYVS
uniref:Uncharacterized protein n=1 Tax=Arundo donax TaxID=35708 RepID=A0A0A9SCA3_ARUDO